MLKIESKIGTINRNISDVYQLASNLENFASMLPEEYKQQLKIEADRLTISHEGKDFTVYVLAMEDNNFIKFGPDENSPVKFFFWIQFKEAGAYITKIKLTMHLDIPFWIQPFVKSKIERSMNDAIDRLSQL